MEALVRCAVLDSRKNLVFWKRNRLTERRIDDIIRLVVMRSTRLSMGL